VRLILTEKPSVARDIARALGLGKGDPFYEGRGLVVAYARGHLLEIARDLAPSPWRLEDLPVLPERFRYEAREGAKELLREIKKVLERAEEVVIATDPGREGELIARLILIELGWKGWQDRTYRLWTAEALTPEVVRREMKRLKRAEEFHSLYYAALARQHADWLVGINLTRLLTLKVSDRTVWSAGRVQTPTLRLIVDREAAIRSFVPTPYGAAVLRFEGRGFAYEGRWMPPQELPPPELAEEAVRKALRAGRGRVAEVKREEKSVPPPLLHSLSSLQREANRRFGFSAKKTLDIAQVLYEEKKVISYPRTDSRHLPDSPEAKDLVREVLKKLGREDLLPAVEKVGKRVFDSTRLTDHHAIIPLDKAVGLTPDEEKVYALVRDRFLAAFSGTYRYRSTLVRTESGGEMWESRFREVLEAGWRAVEGAEEDENEVEAAFPLAEGEGVKVLDGKAEVKKTEPPPRFTEGAMIREMEKLGLGTPATRAEVLETLKERGYVSLSGKALIPTPKGEAVVQALRESPVSDPATTGSWEGRLETIWRERKGGQGYLEFLKGIRSWVAGEVKALLEKDLKSPPLGACACGKPVYDRGKVYACEGGHRVFREVFGKRLSPKQALDLLSGKKVLVKGLKGKSGKAFDAYLRFSLEGNRVEVAGFPERKAVGKR